jgi:hypothetical protein
MSRSPATSGNWTAARCQRHEEWRAAYHAENLGYGYYLPQMREWRQGCESRTFVFPGIIFLHLQRPWQGLMIARDIFRLIFVRDKAAELTPAKVHTGEIQALRSAEDSAGLVQATPRLAPGAVVRVKDGWGGAYSGILGIVRGRSPSGRVRVLLKMLGQEAIGEFEANALSLAA